MHAVRQITAPQLVTVSPQLIDPIVPLPDGAAVSFQAQSRVAEPAPSNADAPTLAATGGVRPIDHSTRWPVADCTRPRVCAAAGPAEIAETIPLSTDGPMCAEAEVFNALTENKSFQGLPDHLIQVQQTTESTHSTMGMLSAAEASRSTRRRRRCRAWSHRAQGTVQTCSSSAQRHDMHTAACSMQRTTKRTAAESMHSTRCIHCCATRSTTTRRCLHRVLRHTMHPPPCVVSTRDDSVCQMRVYATACRDDAGTAQRYARKLDRGV